MTALGDALRPAFAARQELSIPVFVRKTCPAAALNSRTGALAGAPCYTARMEKVNLQQQFANFSDHWSPKIVGELNGQQVKLVKFGGPFVWHHHEAEDELFLVLKGRLRMEFRDRNVELEEGEFLIVPRGVEHRPVAEEEVHVMLFEPATTLNTGNVQDDRTLEVLDRI